MYVNMPHNIYNTLAKKVIQLIHVVMQLAERGEEEVPYHLRSNAYE